VTKNTENTKSTARQGRIERLMAQGYTRSEAVGIVYASEAGRRSPPSHGVDRPSTRLQGGR
jgi:hypothetical protein